MTAAKKRKSALPATGKAAADTPAAKGSCASSSRAALEAASESATIKALSFLDATEFKADVHAPLIYRLGAGAPSGSAAAIKDDAGGTHSGDPVADTLGFPSPFSVMNMTDRKGVWQSTPPLAKELGEDPRKQRRSVVPLTSDGRQAVAPAGLKNLGATCYLNSLVQYLFFNADFRRGLMQAPSSHTAVRALQEVFAQLAWGHRGVVDTAAFVAAAGLEAGEQEDATEFSTLLLDWLQRELGEKGAGGFVQELFEGEVMQIMSCMEHQEHTFERREPFLELRARLSPASGVAPTPRLAAKGSATGPVDTVVGANAAGEQAEAGAPAAAVSKNRPAGPAGKRPGGGKKKSSAPPPVVQLEQLLADTAFPDETLDGDNKYHCPKCDKKVDARKSLRLAKPPPYLHVTVERYHYDLQRGVREKLLNPVSFPRRLQLRVCGAQEGAQGAPPTSYDCIGYLEHVSDSAHEGHYTATLYQDEDDAAAARELAAEPPSAAPREGGEPPAKRQRGCGADATGELRQGVWWTLDDMQATPVQWPQPSPSGAAGNSEQALEADACRAPARIESASAYLILFRRSDLPCCGQPEVGSLRSLCTEANTQFTEEQREFAERSEAVSAFVEERRKAAVALAEALRQAAGEPATASKSLAPKSQLSAVPAAWLQAFLRGEDRSLSDLLSGDAQLPAPVLYGSSLLRAPDGRGLALDPLAIWTGEVRLVPTAALASVGGLGGLDPSLFLTADDCSLGPEVCAKFWRLSQLYFQEWQQLDKILKEGKVSVTDARSLQASGRGEEAVWVSLRVQRMWQKAVGASGGGGARKLPSWQVQALKAFLTEAQGARWADVAEEGEQADASAKEPEGATAATSQTAPAAQPSAQSRAVQRCEVSLTAGLLCSCGLVCRPKAGFLCRRADVRRLLDIAGSKEAAYRELWPDARAVPCVRTGVPGGGLLGFGDACQECREGCADGGGGAQPALARRRLLVRRKYPSGVRRKAGTVAVPEGEAAVTGACIRGLVQEQLGLPVAKIQVVRGRGEGEAELEDGDLLGEGIDHLLVEKDEKADAGMEAAAFSGSVFRGARGAAASGGG